MLLCVLKIIVKCTVTHIGIELALYRDVSVFKFFFLIVDKGVLV
jgi:hypothetical protein